MLNHEIKSNDAVQLRFGIIEKEIEEWIAESISIRIMKRRDLEVFYHSIDIIDNRLEALTEELNGIEDNLLQKINDLKMENFKSIKPELEDKQLDIDYNVVKDFDVTQSYKLYMNRILGFQLNLLNHSVMFDLFEEKKIIKHFKEFKNVFLSERGDVINQIANSLYKSNGSIKLHSFYQIDSIFNQMIPIKAKTKLNFKFRISKIPQDKTNNFVKTNLNDYIKLQNYYSGILKVMLNDKMLNLFFTIFCQLLKITKIDNILSKIWKKSKTMENILSDRKIFNRLCYNIKATAHFINEYKQYIYYFVIEGAFELLLKNAKEAKSFNKLFKVSL